MGNDVVYIFNLDHWIDHKGIMMNWEESTATNEPIPDLDPREIERVFKILRDLPKIPIKLYFIDRAEECIDFFFAFENLGVQKEYNPIFYNVIYGVLIESIGINEFQYLRKKGRIPQAIKSPGIYLLYNNGDIEEYKFKKEGTE